MKMTTEEAFVKVLQMDGISHAFGIIGSAMMPVPDLFPRAGITFWDCAHETNAGLFCDGFAGDGAFGISMNEMTSIGRDQWPAITMVIFRNFQWGAEKRNTTLWFDNNFVGTELDPKLSYAEIADACGLKGVRVSTQEEVTKALHTATEDQANGTTTFIEVILNQELGEPFRRDAMKKPVAVAHVSKADMRPQPGA